MTMTLFLLSTGLPLILKINQKIGHYIKKKNKALPKNKKFCQEALLVNSVVDVCI